MATTDEVLAWVHEQDRNDRELLRSLSPLAWKWARSYAAGSRPPSPEASEHEKQGWRAFRRGYAYPPVWLKREQLDKKMRQ